MHTHLMMSLIYSFMFVVNLYYSNFRFHSYESVLLKNSTKVVHIKSCTAILCAPASVIRHGDISVKLVLLALE